MFFPPHMQMTSSLPPPTPQKNSLLSPSEALGIVFDKSVFWMLFSDTSGFMDLWLQWETKMSLQFLHADEADIIKEYDYSRTEMSRKCHIKCPHSTRL